MPQLTVDGVARRFNPPQTRISLAQLGIPVGEAKECDDSAWLTFHDLTRRASADFQDTVPAELA